MQIKTTHPFVNAVGPVAVGTILDVDADFAAQLLAAKLAEPLKVRKEVATAAPVKETATAPAEPAKQEPAKSEPAKSEPAKEPAKSDA